MKRYFFIGFLLLSLSIGLSLATFPDDMPSQSLVQAIENYVPRMQELTVRVLISENGADFRHIGSGFIASADGYIVTARHVVSAPAKYRVVLDYADIDAEVVFISALTDCAVLKVDLSGLACAQLRADPIVGESVFVIGCPIDPMFEDYVTKGIVSKINVFIPHLSITELFMIDAAVNPGNSGGPVFDTKGNVLGIAIARVPSMSGMGCVVPSADIAYVLEKARETLSKDKGTVN